MFNELKGRTAIITGSGQNIGRGIALVLAKAGVNVMLNGLRDQKKIDKVAAEARALGVEAHAMLADAADPDAIAEVVEETVKRFGSVDIAVSNVGIRPHQSVMEITVEDWRKVINVDLNAAFYLAKAVIPHMQKRKWGRMVCLSGSEWLIVWPNRAHVNAAKAGLNALVKSIALEHGCDGITANCICPGWIDTKRELKNYPNFEARIQHAKDTLPLRKIGEIDDIANTCMYLVSDMGKYVTGQSINVNGGEVMI